MLRVCTGWLTKSYIAESQREVAWTTVKLSSQVLLKLWVVSVAIPSLVDLFVFPSSPPCTPTPPPENTIFF